MIYQYKFDVKFQYNFNDWLDNDIHNILIFRQFCLAIEDIIDFIEITNRKFLLLKSFDYIFRKF